MQPESAADKRCICGHHACQHVNGLCGFCLCRSYHTQEPQAEAGTKASVRWHADPKSCAHYNDDVCPTCDFDGYYATHYPDCPWGYHSDEQG